MPQADEDLVQPRMRLLGLKTQLVARVQVVGKTNQVVLKPVSSREQFSPPVNSASVFGMFFRIA